MRRSCSISLPVLVVLSAIGYLYYTTVFIFIDGWLGLRTSPGLMNAFIFTAMACMCIFNYAVAILRDPGSVPPSFVHDIEDAQTPIHEIKRKGGDLRYCQKCSLFKPPRSHHCRICRRCVLRMDHHCIWINNCVGHANYKVFFVFVAYALSSCIHSLALLVGNVTYDAQKDEQQSEGSLRTAYIISAVLLVPLTVALSILLGWHIYLILHNKTTIEYHEGVRAMWLAEKVGNVYRHPYDLGPYENLTSVLGPSIFTWLCPTSGHMGSGLQFRTSYDGANSLPTLK
ncbi:probable protein S-acyltransferase 16 [Macadamia integrifolia]|uniref:probable protein S-acyltransferase 16 n=1 Tax=Macadamia integrifolia TaxID=60698 RepID=UPI001C52FF48|nr:probable protein S-acyltransferase 16 [Macadamia integrifolia]